MRVDFWSHWPSRPPMAMTASTREQGFGCTYYYPPGAKKSVTLSGRRDGWRRWMGRLLSRTTDFFFIHVYYHGCCRLTKIAPVNYAI